MLVVTMSNDSNVSFFWYLFLSFVHFHTLPFSIAVNDSTLVYIILK